MRKFESNSFLYTCFFSGVHFKQHFLPLYRQKFYGHIPVKCFNVCPATKIMFFGQSFVNCKIVVQFIKINVTILESYDVYCTVKFAQNIIPFFFVLLYRYNSLGFKISTNRTYCFTSLDERRY